jgi:hypothetical protein
VNPRFRACGCGAADALGGPAQSGFAMRAMMLAGPKFLSCSQTVAMEKGE